MKKTFNLINIFCLSLALFFSCAKKEEVQPREIDLKDKVAYKNFVVDAMYKWYRPSTGDHFYTKTQYSSINQYNGEGIAWYQPRFQETGSLPLRRYWNGRDHFYTTNTGSIAGYVFEQEVGYVFTSSNAAQNLLPVYRYFNGSTGDHFYTMYYSSNIPGYVYEGVFFYAWLRASDALL